MDMREKIIAGIKEETLTLINYTDNKNSISWEEDEANEFTFRGKMYDVVHRSVINGKEILHCISDEKESQLVTKYQSAIKDHDGIEKKQKKGVDQPTVFFVYEDQPVKKISAATAFTAIAFNNDNLSAGVSGKNAPPPKA